MALIYKVENIYSESTFSDSISPSFLYQVSQFYKTIGYFSNFDYVDYYQISGIYSGSSYTLVVSTEGYSNTFNNNFTVEIVDWLGNVVLTEDYYHPDFFTDQITFTVNGVSLNSYYVKITNNFQILVLF